MADTTERLLLQVDASIELLRRNLAAGDPVLDRFEKKTAQTAAKVDKSLSEMGGRFGSFAQLADNAATRTQQSFEASFSQIQKLAATAIKGPTIEGGVNLGAADIRAGAAAAQEQARAFALIGEAAQRAAVATGDTSEATRLFIQATAASRIEAEQKATALLKEAGALERVEIELRQSAEATELFVNRHQRVAQAAESEQQLAVATARAAAEQRSLAAAADMLRAELDPMYLAQKRFNQEMDTAEALLRANVIRQHEYDAAVAQSRGTLAAHAQAVTGNVSPTRQLTTSQGSLRAAMQGVSYQTQDTFTQLSMGANVFQVVAIQGGQLAGQFANIEGKAGSFARFMIGPYGLAITAALLVLGPLTKGMFEFGDATDKAVDKLKQDATESDATARAKARFANSVAGLTAALKDQDKALRDTAASERSAAERANIGAKAKRDQALAIRQSTAAKLAEAIADLGDFSQTGGTTGAAALQNAQRSARVVELRKQQTEAAAALRDAERQLNVTRVDLAAEQAATSVDPIRSVTRLYDDRIRALKEQQREEARLGRQIGAASTERLRQLEREKAAAIDKAQATQRAENRTPNNNQRGREIDLSEARAIVASIGGRVTSGLRSREDQERIYSAKLAGRHDGPVAKPGTSDHERGQAVDIAYGPGISIASIREAFAKQGVALRQILNEPAQRVFHVAFGKKGPSAETTENRAEAARQKLLSAGIAFTAEEQQARQRLTAATRKSAETEEQRDAILVASINAEADATAKKIDLQQDKGLSKARADSLRALNEATRKQQLQNVSADAAQRVIDRRYDLEQADLTAQIAVLRIREGIADTLAERRRIGQQILAAEQELRRKTLEQVRDTSNDPKAVQNAKDDLKRLPQLEAAENDNQERRNLGSLDEYRARLRAATDDMNEALGSVAVRGFGALEDAGSQAISASVTNLLHLRGVAGNVIGGVIQDLARLAIQKAIVKAIGSSFFGLAGGGAIGDLPGFAGGGSPGGLITGPGTPTSDSILAILSGGKGAIKVSTEEFIVNAAATRRNLPLLRAINSNQMPGFAAGGSLGSMLQSPRIPSLSLGSGGGREPIMISLAVKKGEAFEAEVIGVSGPHSARMLQSAAPSLIAAATDNTMTELRRPRI